MEVIRPPMRAVAKTSAVAASAPVKALTDRDAQEDNPYQNVPAPPIAIEVVDGLGRGSGRFPAYDHLGHQLCPL